jgi:hypothetical protein
MPCDCHGKDNVEIQRHVLVLLLAINATMFCLEVVADILANSTALLADSLDMLADAAITESPSIRSGNRILRNVERLSPVEFSKAYLDYWLSARSFGTSCTEANPRIRPPPRGKSS